MNALKLRRRARYWFSRWPIANALNKSRRTCWADLCSWAAYGGSLRERDVSSARCRQESVEHQHRTCYCGKWCDGRLR